MKRDRMPGRKNKPHCGNHCCPYHKGSGKRNKRIHTKMVKAQEKRKWQKIATEAIWQ